MKRINRIGQRFGRLVAIRKIIDREKKITYYECLCDCGRVSMHHDSSLQRNNVKSCGCWKNEALANRTRLPSGQASFNQMYHSYKKTAKKKGVEFSLSEMAFRNLTQMPCAYCGIKPSHVYGIRNTAPRNGTYIANGVDRVDSSMGYTLENCVPACKRCNQGKNDMTLDEFYAWVDRVHKHYTSALTVDIKVIGIQN